jgi:hypothetical protein
MEHKYIGYEGVDWIQEAWSRVLWRAVVIWSFGFHKTNEISWCAEQLSDFQAGLCYVSLCIYYDVDERLKVVEEKILKDESHRNG